jgi:hypothetical protein
MGSRVRRNSSNAYHGHDAAGVQKAEVDLFDSDHGLSIRVPEHLLRHSQFFLNFLNIEPVIRFNA